jgi:NAD-dependent dihydropyrimidine dehydrogenase PreA subunit
MKREYHVPSNYRVEYNEKTCIACGKCAGRCPINAIELKDRENPPQPKDGKKLKPKDLKKVVYHEGSCIACGVCVHKCPTQSIRLVKRETPVDTPATIVEAGQRMLMERGRDLGRLF